MKYPILAVLSVFLWLSLSACAPVEDVPGISSAPSPSVSSAQTESPPVQSAPLSEEEIREVGLSCGQTPQGGFGWAELHGDRSRWFEDTQDRAATVSYTSPTLSDAVFYYYDETGQGDIGEISALLLDKLLASMTSECPELRTFTVLDYSIPEQAPMSRAELVDTFTEDTIRLGDAWLPEESADGLAQYFDYWLNVVYPGLDTDMWLLIPDYSFRWSGMAGASSFNPELADEAGLINAKEIVNHSPEADFQIIVKYGNWYRFKTWSI